jgi:hypothetical protein
MSRYLVALLLLVLRVSAAAPAQPGPVLDAAAEPAWQPLFAKLGAARPLYSTFEEQRWFGFRKTPVVLQGEMRLDPAHGLSLHYTQPEERVVVLDAKGVLLRDAHGSRALPSDPRSGGLERALLPALRFEVKELRAAVTVHAARDGDDWRLDLEPKDPATRKSLGNLVIQGSGETVTQLEFRRSASQRVVIHIRSTQEPAAFSAAELQRYFR